MLHLFHPALVHFTVAFLVAGAVCEAFGIFSRREAPQRFGGILLLMGMGSLLPTVVAGYLAANTVALPEGSARLLTVHESVGLGAGALFLLSQLWKAWYAGEIPRAGRLGYAAIVILAAGLVCYGALLGGQMVYGWGIGVLDR